MIEVSIYSDNSHNIPQFDRILEIRSPAPTLPASIAQWSARQTRWVVTFSPDNRYRLKTNATWPCDLYTFSGYLRVVWVAPTLIWRTKLEKTSKGTK